MKYRKKPLVVDAMKWSGGKDIVNWSKSLDTNPETKLKHLTYNGEEHLQVYTLEGVFSVKKGDYVIIGIKGELYSCDGLIFEETYESVEK